MDYTQLTVQDVMDKINAQIDTAQKAIDTARTDSSIDSMTLVQTIQAQQAIIDDGHNEFAKLKEFTDVSFAPAVEAKNNKVQ